MFPNISFTHSMLSVASIDNKLKGKIWLSQKLRKNWEREEGKRKIRNKCKRRRRFDSRIWNILD